MYIFVLNYNQACCSASVGFHWTPLGFVHSLQGKTLIGKIILVGANRQWAGVEAWFLHDDWTNSFRSGNTFLMKGSPVSGVCIAIKSMSMYWRIDNLITGPTKERPLFHRSSDHH